MICPNDLPNGQPCGDEGHLCDACQIEAEQAHTYLKYLPRHAVFGNAGGSTDAATTDRMRQDLIDAGRGHLVDGVLADRIDMARMREKDGK